MRGRPRGREEDRQEVGTDLRSSRCPSVGTPFLTHLILFASSYYVRAVYCW